MRKKNKMSEKKRETSGDKPPPIQRLLYPHSPSKKGKERQFTRFIDNLKQQQINIPFL